MIRTNSLSKVFRTDEIETTALNNVEFKADQGEFVAVMGPSGCGKSTLLNILGLLDTPSNGQYYFMDKEELMASSKDELVEQIIGMKEKMSGGGKCHCKCEECGKCTGFKSEEPA